MPREARHERAAVLENFLAVIGVNRQPDALFAEIERQRVQAPHFPLLVERGPAAAINAVVANAELIVVAAASPDVDMRAELRTGCVIRADAGDRRVAGMFGDEIDRAADRAERRHAVEQRARPLEHFDALQEFGRHMAVGRETIHAIERELAAEHGEAANSEILANVPGRRGHADRRIVLQDLLQGARLLVLDQRRRVARHIERRIHEIAIAEHAEPAAASDLASGVGRRKIADFARWRRRRNAACAGEQRRTDLRGGGSRAVRRRSHVRSRAARMNAARPCARRDWTLRLLPRFGLRLFARRVHGHRRQCLRAVLRQSRCDFERDHDRRAETTYKQGFFPDRRDVQAGKSGMFLSHSSASTIVQRDASRCMLHIARIFFFRQLCNRHFGSILSTM